MTQSSEVREGVLEETHPELDSEGQGGMFRRALDKCKSRCKATRLTQYVWQAAGVAVLLGCEISREEGGWSVLDAQGQSLSAFSHFILSQPVCKAMRSGA